MWILSTSLANKPSRSKANILRLEYEMRPFYTHGGVIDPIQERLALFGLFADIWTVLSHLL